MAGVIALLVPSLLTALVVTQTFGGDGRLVLDELLPLAAAGLDAWRVDPVDRDRYLGVIEERCRTGLNGAEWQARSYHRLREHEGLARAEALAAMTRRYCALMRTGEPVHTWPVE